MWPSSSTCDTDSSEAILPTTSNKGTTQKEELDISVEFLCRRDFLKPSGARVLVKVKSLVNFLCSDLWAFRYLFLNVTSPPFLEF